ncbi:MAG: hypothetical protein JOZ78_19490 [Chroococcidiopsidaceae cyanobacterium CP_BM_ER_R8_30]|nr:hypothetical protein [Chroococcidiopsidaceae cyanobacterium CP_BM_ER_R8_30]
MSSDSEDPFPSLFRQLLPFLIGLLDDALVVGFSRLGCHIPWLESLSPIVMGCTALYMAVQFWHHGFPKLVEMWCEFRQPESAPEICKD